MNVQKICTNLITKLLFTLHERFTLFRNHTTFVRPQGVKFSQPVSNQGPSPDDTHAPSIKGKRRCV